MGTRSSRLQEESVSTPFEKDGIKRESCRRIRNTRPTSLVVDFASSFDHDSEANRSRSEEGSDSDTGQQVSADGSPGELHISPSLTSESSPTDENDTVGKHEDDDIPGSPVNSARLSGEETGRVNHRTLAERLPGGRVSSGRSVTARPTRVRNTRPVSDAWIGVYRVRHGTIRCPFCTKLFPGGRIEEHLLSCLTSPPLPYNSESYFFSLSLYLSPTLRLKHLTFSSHSADVLSKDSGECSICLEDLFQGDTIARLACLCVYHKK
uniref:RING-type E3 ubiquitin transferase n=1 Tax=Electrophorus electricus TaxID=8005 RepID=A0A4W4FPQ6_ELEEL